MWGLILGVSRVGRTFSGSMAGSIGILSFYYLTMFFDDVDCPSMLVSVSL
jgi:hypothetical protein